MLGYVADAAANDRSYRPHIDQLACQRWKRLWDHGLNRLIGADGHVLVSEKRWKKACAQRKFDTNVGSVDYYLQQLTVLSLPKLHPIHHQDCPEAWQAKHIAILRQFPPPSLNSPPRTFLKIVPPFGSRTPTQPSSPRPRPASPPAPRPSSTRTPPASSSRPRSRSRSSSPSPRTRRPARTPPAGSPSCRRRGAR
jgi:hypothetical protein